MVGQQSRLGTVATKVRKDSDGVVRVTYHYTDVVTIYPNGRIVLDHGGRWTATTKTRMNQASNQFGLGFHVYQQNWRWYVDVDGHEIKFDHSPLVIRNGLSERG